MKELYTLIIRKNDAKEDSLRVEYLHGRSSMLTAVTTMQWAFEHSRYKTMVIEAVKEDKRDFFWIVEK
jgi:hypothetical protein